mmetsp:Transcript_19716/g.54837  ORF Transcript_19716/g.54837 Transcript_19716/m.54837 type:complete len:308 (+) Transcript_19716:276-1199(+)
MPSISWHYCQQSRIQCAPLSTARPSECAGVPSSASIPSSYHKIFHLSSAIHSIPHCYSGSPFENSSEDREVSFQHADLSFGWHANQVVVVVLLRGLQFVAEEFRLHAERLSHLIKNRLNVGLKEDGGSLRHVPCKRRHQLLRHHSSLGMLRFEMRVGELDGDHLKLVLGVSEIHQPIQVDVRIATNEGEESIQPMLRHPILGMAHDDGSDLQSHVVVLPGILGSNIHKEPSAGTTNVQEHRPAHVIEHVVWPILRQFCIHLKPPGERIDVLTATGRFGFGTFLNAGVVPWRHAMRRRLFFACSFPIL